MIGVLERAVRDPVNTSFHTTFGHHGSTVQELIDTLDDALSSYNDGALSIPEHDTAPALKRLLQILNHPQLRAEIR